MLLVLTTLLAGCGTCGTYDFVIEGAVLEPAIEPCGAMAGSEAALADDGTLWLRLQPEARHAKDQPALDEASPELELFLPSSAMHAGTTVAIDELSGSASLRSPADGETLLAPLVDGSVTFDHPRGTSMLGEPRWVLQWQLSFASEALAVDVEGHDKVDIVADPEDAAF